MLWLAVQAIIGIEFWVAEKMSKSQSKAFSFQIVAFDWTFVAYDFPFEGYDFRIECYDLQFEGYGFQIVAFNLEIIAFDVEIVANLIDNFATIFFIAHRFSNRSNTGASSAPQYVILHWSFVALYSMQMGSHRSHFVILGF